MVVAISCVGLGTAYELRANTAVKPPHSGLRPARVIDFIAPEGTVWLLMVYSKAKFDNLPASFLAQLKKGVQDAI